VTVHRPRTSTVVLIVAFLGVLALWVWVRPITPDTTGSATPAGTQPASTSSASVTPSTSPSPTHSASPTQTSSPTPTSSATSSPSPTSATTSPDVGASGASAASP
jgi:cytoskeletal protein RodZ